MNKSVTELLEKLYETTELTREEYVYLIKNRFAQTSNYLFSLSRKRREQYYGKDVYIRGLIEFTNYCKNNCYYCGIRCSNKNVNRYRLEKKEILECCHQGYDLGFRTFVLQGGEDPYYSDDILCDIVSAIKTHHSDCAVTLSVGERSRDSYKNLYDAGADRYLLRHETADNTHYGKLHPIYMSHDNRKKCLYDLKEIGYQTGTGFMVGSPYQTAENLADDMLFIKDLEPEMVGIGPFICHKDTPFAKMSSGTLELTLFMIGLIRLTLPCALIPATTALGTISPSGREQGIEAGANVVMPNLSPNNVRKDYMLYDNKISFGEESAQNVKILVDKIEAMGYKIVVSRGDAANKI